MIVLGLRHRRELDPLAIHPALEKAILELGHLRQSLRHPERNETEYEGDREASQASGEAVGFLLPLPLGQAAMSIGHEDILPRNAAEREAMRWLLFTLARGGKSYVARDAADALCRPAAPPSAVLRSESESDNDPNIAGIRVGR